MDKLIVTVFDGESRAYEGVKALKELDGEGSLTLYATAVIAKDAKGAFSVKQTDGPGPAGTVVGLATGSLIGLLGGPIGLAVGAVSGTVLGSLHDLALLGIDSDFVDEVSHQLLPGKTAVIAEVDEEWVMPLDTRMESLGGVVVRRARWDFVDAQIDREIAADQAELAQLKAEHAQAVGKAKAALQARMDAVEKRLQARRDKFAAKIAAIKREGEAKIQALQDQAAKAKSNRKAQWEKRVADARARHQARAEKLSQAWQLVKEAATL